MKTNRGVTLIMLVITVIVLAILTATAINVGYSSYKNAELAGYVATMNMIQSRVNVINQKIKDGDTSYDTVGIELSALDSATQEEINVAVGGQTIQGFKYYDETQLELLGVSNIEEEVIINLSTREIYSLVSIEYEGVKYYNQYELPNGIKLVEYTGLTTAAPEFEIVKNNYGLTTEVSITNIIYDEQISGSEIYYGEVTDSTTDPVTVTSWRQVQGTSFSVTKTATYAIKLIDKNGGQTIKTVDVVTCNAPELTSGMVPVIYEEGNWKKVSDEEMGQWYDYSEGKWANIMLSDGLVLAEDGTITNMGSMFVWIPRYAYQITSEYHNGGEGISGNINVKFLKNVTYLTTDETTTKMTNASGEGNWNVHPAFIDGSENDYANGGWDRELTGFWVAKFEASSSDPALDYGGGDVTTLDVKVLPNVTSWRNISLANMFSNCLSMNEVGNIYGIPTNAITHLMKNSEWGAVAYLTQSKYGRNGVEVTINDSSTYITGNAGNVVDSEGNTGGITNAYDTEKGALASTTGNIYGVYDMSGGADEMMAATLEKFISTIFESVDEKYIDQYFGEGVSVYEIEGNVAKYGDAMYEVSVAGNVANNSDAWHGDSMRSLFDRWDTTLALAGCVKRGNAYDRGINAGIFAANGNCVDKLADWIQPYLSFRPTIIIE